MANPNWSRITPDGKPFGYIDPKVKPLTDEIEELIKENFSLKKENEQLRQLLEEDTKPKSK